MKELIWVTQDVEMAELMAEMLITSRANLQERVLQLDERSSQLFESAA